MSDNQTCPCGAVPCSCKPARLSATQIADTMEMVRYDGDGRSGIIRQLCREIRASWAECAELRAEVGRLKADKALLLEHYNLCIKERDEWRQQHENLLAMYQAEVATSAELQKREREAVDRAEYAASVAAVQAHADHWQSEAMRVSAEVERLRALLRAADVCAHGRESGCCIECSAAGRFVEP
jgi:hypothetical protein